MLGRDHALSGAAAFALAAPLLHATGRDLAAGIVLTAGAALLPDIDEPGSTIAREGGFLTETLAAVAHRVSGGHRKGTHSLAGVAVFTTATGLAVLFSRSVWSQAALILFLGLLLAAAPHAVRLGGHRADLIAVSAAAAAVHWHAGLTLAPLCIALGALAHIAGDMLTHGGCPLLYPFSRREFHSLPGPLRFTTGKSAERLVTVLLVTALVFGVWHDTIR